MKTFEEEYYEDSSFWEVGMVEDFANIQRIEQTIDLIPLKVKSVIDVGCGNGIFAKYLRGKRPDIQISCIDRSKEALKHVDADYKYQRDIVDLSNFENMSYDCVTSLQVLEHLPVPNYELALKELARISGRYILIGVPYKEQIEDNMTTCPSCHTKFNLDLHLRSFSSSNFDKMLESYGFCLEKKVYPVPVTNYLGFRTYYKIKSGLFFKKEKHRFTSPICPVCGYTSKNNHNMDVKSELVKLPPKEVKRSQLKNYIRSIWPRTIDRGYWMIGLFSRC